MPRPSLGYTTLAPLKVTPATAAKIAEIAQLPGMSKQEVIRRALEIGLPRLAAGLPAL